MSDTERIDKLEAELAKANKRIAFLAAFINLSDAGHATSGEHGQRRLIAEGYDRFEPVA